jgi:bifunctional non-homologous end joining protein LigD
MDIAPTSKAEKRLYEQLRADGLTPFAATSGSKGMQLYCAIDLSGTDDINRPLAYAKALAQRASGHEKIRVCGQLSPGVWT